MRKKIFTPITQVYTQERVIETHGQSLEYCRIEKYKKVNPQ